MWVCKCVRMVLVVSAVDDTNVNGCGSDNQDSVIGTGPTCRLYDWGVVLNSWQEQDIVRFSSPVCPD
jgi:multimeric flavodoxin WrbA